MSNTETVSAIEILRDYDREMTVKTRAMLADEIERLSDQNSSLLATNYDLRKERDRLTDELGAIYAACRTNPDLADYVFDVFGQAVWITQPDTTADQSND